MKVIYDPITKETKIEQSPSEEIEGGEILEYKDLLEIREGRIGLPIYDTTSGLIQKNGTIVIIKTNSTSNRLRIRAGNINSSVSTS